MGFTLIDLLALSIALAAIIAAVRYRQINRRYDPFLYLIWISLVTEIVINILVYSGSDTYIPFNIFPLIEVLLLVWWFHRMRFFKIGSWLLVAIVILSVCWLVQSLFLEGFTQNMTYFRLLAGFFILVCSSLIIAREAATQRDPLWQSPVFLISIGMLIYFSMVIILGVFDIYGVEAKLSSQMQGAMAYVNAFVNFIYAIAVLCMTRNLRFTLPL